jgi:hypothetical protein
MKVNNRKYLINAKIADRVKKQLEGKDYTPADYEAATTEIKNGICKALQISISTLNRDINAKRITHSRLIAYSTYFKCKPEQLVKQQPVKA